MRIGFINDELTRVRFELEIAGDRIKELEIAIKKVTEERDALQRSLIEAEKRNKYLAPEIIPVTSYGFAVAGLGVTQNVLHKWD